MEALGYDKVPLEVTKMVSLPVLAHYHVKSCYDTVDLPPWLYTVTVHCPQNFMPVFLAHLFTYVGNLCRIQCVCVNDSYFIALEPVPEAVLVPVVPVHAPELTCQFQLQPRWPRWFRLQPQWPLWFQSELLWPRQFQSQRWWLCQFWSQRQHSRRSLWRRQHQCQDILNSFFKIIFLVLYQWIDKMHSYIH